MFKRKRDEYDWDMLIHNRLEYLGRDLSILMNDIDTVKKRIEMFFKEVRKTQGEFDLALQPERNASVAATEFESDLLVHSRLEYLARSITIMLVDFEKTRERVRLFYEEVLQIQNRFEPALQPENKLKSLKNAE